ncbi:MAG: DUF4377 domain-containing protein [Pseudomonadota bacterium]
MKPGHTILNPLIVTVFAGLVLFGLVGCGGGAGSDDSNASTVELNFHRNGCIGESTSLCLQVADGDDSYLNFYDAIDGFTFEWGYRYTLRIAATEIEDPPADASSIQYSLLEQIARTAATDAGEFDVMVLATDLNIERRESDLYLLNGEKLFDCDAVTCASLDALMSQEFAATMVFSLDTNIDAPMRLERIICSDSLPGFFSSCN